MNCSNAVKIVNIKSLSEIKDSPDGTVFELLHVGREWGDDWGKKVNVMKCQNKLFYFTDYIDIDEIDDIDYEVLVAETKIFPQYK